MLSMKDTRVPVPVYTVQSLPYSYELIKTIVTVDSGQNLEDYTKSFDKLGMIASEINADAVIGVTITPNVGTDSQYVVMGTAIKYAIY
jgi:uncharacterized protein YbjQ (UPF0145 family)